MIDRRPFDLKGYVHDIATRPCFICGLVKNDPPFFHHRILEDSETIIFLSKYPTLPGYCLVCPREHREDLARDLSKDEYLRLQEKVHVLSRALRNVFDAERIYVLSLGSQQANSHLHFHVVPLPAGVPLEEQQYHALMAEHGVLRIPDDQMALLAQRIAEAYHSELTAPKVANPAPSTPKSQLKHQQDHQEMTASPRFLGFPDRLADGRMPRAVIFGVGHGSTYPGRDSSGHALATDAIRAASQDDAALVEHWDFDLGGPLFDGKPVCCIDAGDILTTMHDNTGNRARIEARTREVLSLPAVPILLGGDCSVTIPFLAGFLDHGPVWVLQIDAHIDWHDEVHGERHGYSSPMRRASEMPHVAGIVQVGIRGVGSTRLADIEAARHYGSRFVTAREVHAQGVEAALRHIPQGARIVITLDCDGLDPGIMPGVAARTPGGLTYTQVIDLIAGLGRRARIAGFDLVELYPPADIDGLSALTAARLLVNVIGTIVRQV